MHINIIITLQTWNNTILIKFISDYRFLMKKRQIRVTLFLPSKLELGQMGQGKKWKKGRHQLFSNSYMSTDCTF